LNPDDAPEIIADTVFGETQDVLLVGHRPSLFLLLRELLPESAPFPTHGFVVLEREDETTPWREAWRAEPD
jgi:phosphohistidine phosphatase SixA